jgi:glycosyltransferase involved in cell wall biosynthesis
MPVQAEALLRGLRREGIAALAIRTNLGGGRVRHAIDSIRVLRTVVRAPVFLARLIALVPRVDIVHVNACSGLSFFLFATPAILAARALGRRAILHYHSGNARRFFDRWPRLTRWIISRAHRILVPSGFLRETFADIGFEATVVPNICELERFAVLSQKVLRPRLVIARNLEPVYGIWCALDGFARLLQRYADATLTVLGTGSEEAALKRQVVKLGLQPNVRFLGEVPNRQIPDVFSEACIFVNASLSDNQPVSILEAFAAGLPVVTSDAGGIPHLVRDRVNGLLFPVGDSDALAARVIELLEHPDQARAIAANARTTIEAYSWASVFVRLREVYGFDTKLAAGFSGDAPPALPGSRCDVAAPQAYIRS